MGTAICVLGMHRSGTSLVAGALSYLGCYLGNKMELAQGNKANPKGFWENRNFIYLNDAILQRHESSWYTPPVFKESNWYQHPSLRDLKRQAQEVIKEDFEDKPLWGWKDPRTCLTLPFWQYLIPDIKYILCIRNPINVLDSLKERDNFSFELSDQLWRRYTADSIIYTADKPILVLFYQDFIEDVPRTTARIKKFISGEEPSEIEYDIVADLVDRGLQHHKWSAIETIKATTVSHRAKLLFSTLRAAGEYTAEHNRWPYNSDYFKMLSEEALVDN